jgi:hypothetical protein
MIHIKNYYKVFSNEDIQTEHYTLPGISPSHIHKEKNAHKNALLTPSSEIVTHIHGRLMDV